MRLSDQVHMLPPPPGHCYLYQAVNAVGRVKIGSDWTEVCCQDELRGRMRDPSAALQITIKTVADACAGAKIKASYRNRDGGIDDIDRAEWAKQVWESYFASGEVILYLPWVPPIPGSLARCERTIFVRKDSLEGFVADSKPTVVSARYPSDATLIEEGRRMLESGMQKRAIARKRAEGAGTFESKVDRLRRLL